MGGGAGQIRMPLGERRNDDVLESRRFNRRYLQLLGATAGGPLRDGLQLFDSLAEVCHPLDHSHSGRDGVAAPAAREDA